MVINGEKIELLDDFNLSDFVINAKFGDAEKLTMQLLSQTASGSINLQYMGTKVRAELALNEVFTQLNVHFICF